MKKYGFYITYALLFNYISSFFSYIQIINMMKLQALQQKMAVLHEESAQVRLGIEFEKISIIFLLIIFIILEIIVIIT